MVTITQYQKAFFSLAFSLAHNTVFLFPLKHKMLYESFSNHTGEYCQVLHADKKKYKMQKHFVDLFIIFTLNMFVICISAYHFILCVTKGYSVVQTQMQNPMQMYTFLPLSFSAMHSIIVPSKSPSDQWAQGPHIMKVSMTQDPVSLISK